MRHIAHLALVCLIGILSPVARADLSTEIAEAVRPLSEGVPEVAVVRLQSLLNKNLSESQWRAVAEKLAKAQVAANDPEGTLVLLTDGRLHDLPWAKFWRAQALASLHRWADALPLYEGLSNDTSPFQKPAVFGAGDALRALGNRQEALQKFILLVHDKEWSTRAQLRAAELHIELGNAPEARRVLEQMQPASIAERRERRVLRGRLELISHRPERAIGMFAAILKRLEIRAGRKERARQLFTDLRQTEIKSPAIAAALFEFAKFETDEGRFDEAIAILDDARLLRPDPALLTRIDFLSAQVQYLARQFDTATAAFEQIAQRDSQCAKAALFNASRGCW